MTAEQVIQHSLPLAPGYQLRVLRDETIIIERWVEKTVPGGNGHYASELQARFRTPFDLNYTLRSLGIAQGSETVL